MDQSDSTARMGRDCIRAAEDLELFLLIGQSDLAGRGVIEPQDVDPSANIYALAQDLTWKPAVDPLHFDKPDIAGVGLGRSFASGSLGSGRASRWLDPRCIRRHKLEGVVA